MFKILMSIGDYTKWLQFYSISVNKIEEKLTWTFQANCKKLREENHTPCNSGALRLPAVNTLFCAFVCRLFVLIYIGRWCTSKIKLSGSPTLTNFDGQVLALLFHETQFSRRRQLTKRFTNCHWKGRFSNIVTNVVVMVYGCVLL